MQRSIRPDGGGGVRAHAITFFVSTFLKVARLKKSSLFIIVQSLCVFTIVPFVFESFEILKEKRDGTTADKEEEIRR